VETVTRRFWAQHCGPNESAAIAITAKLLSGLKTGAADAIYLIPEVRAPRYTQFSGNFAFSDGGSRFHRRHDSIDGITWFGAERQTDQLGRVWERPFEAVIDDFGNLVEVAP
jgi:hypothetical protein